MYDALHDALYTLQAAGAKGFEGLILAHISRLTGRRFFLAKRGAPQGGKDAGTAAYGATYIDIECKRYRKGASSPARDLIGGLGQAIDAGAGRLDLWLVVSTGVIGTIEAEALRRRADKEGVAVEIIDWQKAGPPQLGVLCAAFSEETLAELRVRGASDNLAGVASDLRAVKHDPGFSQQMADLKRRLSAADLGLDHARAVANAWIEAHLVRKADVMAAFNQALCVGDAHFQPYVERTAPQTSLEAWYASWQEHYSLTAVLGREGNGKSWATMAWWRQLDARPLTLVITSNRVTASEALTLVASALRVQTGARDIAFWKRRVQQWLQRPASATPTFLLVLDGLNERPRQLWEQVFTSLAESDWAGRLAIVGTCRPPFWSERVAPFLPDCLPVTQIDVQPFDDEELARAWGDRRPVLSEVPKAVRDFIRTPRIFRLARDHIERLMQSGDLTVERLLIEDWADRRQHKLGFAHSLLDFNNLVIELARDLRQGLPEFRRHQLRGYSSLARRSPDRDLDKDFDEIIDGQLFEPVDLVSDCHRVRTEYVGLALGMLLAREVRDAYRRLGADGIEGVLAEELDHVTDLDQTSATLRGACAVACLESEYPAEARRMLLREWLYRPNLDESQWHDFAAYLPLHPDTYFDLAEDFWFGDDIYPTRREWVTDAILRWRGLPAIQAHIAARCARWLGVWHTDWHPFLWKPDPDWLARQRHTVSENWSRLADSERRLADQFLSQAPTPHAPFIARLALLLLSHGPRLAHVQGFIAWALSRTIMQLPDEIEEVAWCLRLNRHDAAETEAALLRQVEGLLENASDLGIQAARSLLWACGTPVAAARLADLPAPPREEFRSRRRLIEVDPLDPSAPAPADLALVSDRLAGLDRGHFWHEFGLTAEEHRFDELEPILARFAPQVVSGFFRRLIQSAPERQGMSLRQLGWQISKHLILIGPEEARALDKARRSLLPLLESDPHDASATEASILTGLLGHQTAEAQLKLLLDRPENALDLEIFENVFAAVPPELANGRIVRAAAEGHAYELRRLLWVLSRRTFTLSEAARSALVQCFGHTDPGVRASAFRLAVRCNDRAALSVHITSEWCARLDDTTFESFYGSLALIAAADPVDYLSLRSRVVPELLGYLALRDGSPRAFDAFAGDLDALWETMMRTPVLPTEMTRAIVSRAPLSDPAMPKHEPVSIEPWVETALRSIRVFGRGPSANELKNFFEQFDPDISIHEQRDFEERVKKVIAEARQAGHHFFGKPMQGYALPEVIARHSQLIEKWIAYLVQCDTVPWDTAEFYRALCPAVGATDPDCAADILACLRHASTVSRLTYRPWNVDILTWLAFQLPSSQKVDEVRERVLEEANTDELLFQIALAAQAVGASDWLAHVIRQDLGAPGIHRAARALTLIGFLGEGALLEVLRHELDGRTGFLKDVATCAEGRLERNHRARAWFAQFLARRDPVEAWAAFRLFLRCVDRRFYLWGNAIRNATLDLPLLWHQQVNINDQDIRRATEKNEGKLSEILFGLRIAKNEIASWYRTPPVANTS